MAIAPGSRVCIVGAGLSGLITAHEAIKAGMIPTLFELRGGVGGLFNREDTEHCDDSRISSYDDLYLTISNYLMAFGGAPPEPSERRRFWSRAEYLRYLLDFATANRILEHTRFRHQIQRITHEQDGTYRVQVDDLGNGISTVEQFDAVAVCTGTNSRAFVPPVQGIASFPGEVKHAGEFNGAEEDPAYKGKRVLVVGFGESGADTVRMVSQVSSSTVLSLRSFPFVVQRLLHDETKYKPGEAADALTSPGHHLLRKNMFLWAMMLVASVCHYMYSWLRSNVAARNDQSSEPIAEPQGGWHSGYARHTHAPDAFGQTTGKQIDRDTPFSEEAIQLQREWNSKSRFKTFATKNYSSAAALLKSSTQINTAGIDKVDGSTIYFKDGDKAENVDTILWNTGYTDDFSFLAPELCPEAGARSLFKNAFKVGGPCTLSFIGWARPSFGGVPACSEMVARYWMMLLRGDKTLPVKREAIQIIEADTAMYKELFPLSNLGTLVDLYCYMDSMAGLVGCRPSLWRLGLTGQFDLVWKYLYGQHVPSWYRLYGPGSHFKTHAAVIRRLPVCLKPLNTIKHAAANLVNSTGMVRAGERFDLMEYFNM